jgi:hypothetical protein
MRRGLFALSFSRAGPPENADQTWRERLASFADDTAGDIAMLFGLMAMVMFMLIGAAVDMGRWLNARDQTVSAIDAAVLAAGRALQTNGGDQVKALAVAKAYYLEGIKGRLALKSDTIGFQIVDNGTAVTATGSATIATPFMGVCCGTNAVKELPLLSLSGSEFSKAVLAIGGNAELNLEISMMLDTSGSMGETTASGNPKYLDMRDAASDLVNIVVWDDQSKYKSRVAIVPFSGDVRVPTTILSQITDPLSVAWIALNGSSNRSYKYYIAPCVAERFGNNKHTDATPGLGAYIPYEYTSNGQCAQSQTSDEVLPMTNNKTTLINKINGLVPRGATAGHIGTAWSYYMLSPNWASKLPYASQPSAYNAPKTQKIAILMTDGEYNSTHDKNGVTTGQNGAGSSGNGNDSSGQAIAICNQMKQDGIDVYTVGFNMSGATPNAVNTLKNCASDASKYYDAEDGDMLKNSFRDIALKISSLYLAK